MSKQQTTNELDSAINKKKKPTKKGKLNPIVVHNGDKKIIKKEFKTSYYTIRKALKGDTTTVLGYKIRRFAKKLGGEEFPDDKPIQ